MNLNGKNAYLRKAAYHKCLFISTCDKNLLKLQPQTNNDV